ncbi:MAG: signal recognition particle protein [Acidobacteria bacterium]|nr:MAG: signal recognition particle protein [Acidobacteriota bacterium]
MFDALSEKLEGVFRTLRAQGSLTAADVEAALREIRLALLEADVHFKVTKQFLDRVREKATGQEVLRSLTPAQAVIRIVRDEMVSLLGGEEAPRVLTSPRLPSVVLMAGLQGSGKTTTAAKLGAWLARSGHHPLLVSTDVYRPAAREQLQTLGTQAGLKVHHPPLQEPAAILRSALDEARAVGHEFVIVDTAGRLHIDDELMAELAALKEQAQPSEVLYVADAMTGQDAVRSAEEFHRRVGITGIVLSKLDGDARGGAALSAAAVTGCPVKFAGVGERVDEFELFQPGRMVGRILGMGDVLGLIEKAEQHVDREKAEEMVRKLRKAEFTLDDYKDQLGQMRKMGSLDQIMGMIPGLKVKDVDTEAGEAEMRRHVAIIDSMTPLERREPSVINGSRRKRIAKGSGTTVEDVNRLLKQYVQARKMMKQFGGGGGKMLKKLAARMPPQFRQG